jgi:hypothetical protein
MVGPGRSARWIRRDGCLGAAKWRRAANAGQQDAWRPCNTGYTRRGHAQTHCAAPDADMRGGPPDHRYMAWTIDAIDFSQTLLQLGFAD